MHSQREFFHAVLAGEGKPCLAWMKPGDKGFRHLVYDSIDEFCDGIDDIDYLSANFYFAISTLKQASVIEGEKKRVRVQTNMQSTRCFILDVDVRPDKEGYCHTIEEAVEGVREFGAAMNLPDPILVNSGFGLHVYWPMAGGVDSREWSKVANRLKRACEMIAPKLVADGSRVSDSAGVLRIPFSFNLKGKPPVAVEIIQWSDEVVDFDKLSTLLLRIAGGDQAKKLVEVGTSFVQSGPSDFKQVAKNCNWTAEYLKNKSNASEPEWYAMLGMVPFLSLKKKDSEEEITGIELAHLVSKGHKDYDAEATFNKYNQASTGQSGPTTCSKFASINSARCVGCPFAATVKSPVQTAKLARPATVPVTVQTTTHDEQGQTQEETVTIPLPPKPYFRGENGGVYVRVKTKVEGEGGAEWAEEIIKIYDYDIYPTKRVRNESSESELMEIHLWLPKDGLRKFKLQNGLLADNKKFNQFLSEKGAVAEFGKSAHLVKFLIDYVRHLQMTHAAEVEFSRFGWRDILSADPKFVTGDGVLTKQGLEPSALAPFLKDATKAASSKGSLENWKKGFAVYKSIPDSEAYILAAMLGFAAPLMALTEYSGVLYNMVGHSAAGKSTALKVMTSVWGSPNPQHVLVGDTDIATFNFIGYLNNIPVAFDEVTKMEGDKASSFALNFTGGRGKMRAGRDGANRDNNVQWDTIVCSTSNTSLYDKLANARRGYSAEAMRIFELPVGESDAHYKGHVDASINLLRDNHGMAGKAFIEFVLPRAKAIQGILDKAIQSITAKGKLRNEERFWGALLACVLVGGKIARDNLKLHDYDTDALVNWAMGLSEGVRTAVQTTISDPVSTLSEFFNNNLTSILRCNDGMPDLAAMNGTMHSVRARLDYKDKVPEFGWVSSQSLREYCKLRNIDPSWLRRELMDKGVILEENVQKRLTTGTNLPNVNVKCWKIDLQHPELIEQVTKYVEPELLG